MVGIGRPRIFISAVTRELGSARDMVADALQALGYEPVRQNIFSLPETDLRDSLKSEIDSCKAVIQLVGFRYGFEPVSSGGDVRRSYTQFEAEYAEEKKKTVYYFILDEAFPFDPEPEEPEELRNLQLEYREKILDSNRNRVECITTREGLDSQVRRLRNDLKTLRRNTKMMRPVAAVYDGMSKSYRYNHGGALYPLSMRS